jgi:isopentenyl diphosphate isomerase/L-lactate dehydrogenase-like FMN-dependent dehydrogenase
MAGGRCDFDEGFPRGRSAVWMGWMAKRDAKGKRNKLLTLEDYERAAKTRLSKMAWDYFRSGADRERALARNLRAYERLVVWYRVLVDVAERELSTTVLGTPVRAPILVAPTAYHRLAHPEGELATARGAAQAGTIYVASTLATTRLEDVAEASDAPKWFQVYVHKDRAFTQSLVERAEAAGYDALVVTVDTPMLGRRLRDERNGFALPEGLSMANLVPPGESEAHGSMLASYVAERHDASFSFRDLEWLKRLSHLPLVIKGVVRADDARRAIDHGAAAILVSNHGGRQLDASPATLEALPGVVEAVGHDGEVYVDGGIRSGEDVFKALALGARAVLVGRPSLWGLAVGGSEGVADVLRILSEELSRTMALAGAPSVHAIDRSMVAPG